MENHETYSLPLAAYLLANNFNLKDLKESGPNNDKILFIFEDHPDIKAEVEAYFLNTPVSCMSFYEAIKRVKAIIWEKHKKKGE